MFAWKAVPNYMHNTVKHLKKSIQLTFTCSKSAIETLEKRVNYV